MWESMQPEDIEITLLKYQKDKNLSTHNSILSASNFIKEQVIKIFPDQKHTENARRVPCWKTWYKEMLRGVFQPEGIWY